MGNRNDDRRRRLDRSEAPQMSDLQRRLDVARKVLDRPNLTATEAVLAAQDIARASTDVIMALTARKTLDNPLLRATGYKVESDVDNHNMRLSFFHGAESSILSWMILPSDEVYLLSNKCMAVFDKLEGVE